MHVYSAVKGNRSGAALSGLAMSTLAIWCHVVQFRDVSPHNFDGPAMSGIAISVAPWTRIQYDSQMHVDVVSRGY